MGLGGSRNSGASAGASAADVHAAWVRATAEDSEDAGIDCGSDSDVLRSEHSVSGVAKTEDLDDASMHHNSSNQDSFSSLVERTSAAEASIGERAREIVDSNATSPSLSPRRDPH